MKWLVTIIFAILNATSYAQNISFSTVVDNHQLIYGIYNRIILQSEKDDCGQYFLKSENALIEKDKCEYIIIPKEIGKLKVEVYKLNNNDTLKVKTHNFSVRSFALKAEIGNLSGGQVRKSTFKVQRGVTVSVDNSITPFSGDIRFSIIEHSILILRNDSCLYQETSKESVFSQELRNKLQNLQSNDKVFLYNVIAKGPYGNEREVASVIFEIID